VFIKLRKNEKKELKKREKEDRMIEKYLARE